MQCCRRDLKEEDPMNVSRRELAVAGAVALTAPGLLLGGLASAQAADEAAVKESVEVLRKALLEADKAKLEQIASAQISYGHSDGRVETKEQFVNGVPTGWPTLTTSRPGYLCWISISCSVISSGGPTSHVPALIALRRVGSPA